MGNRRDRRRHHDPHEGETRAPMTEGTQRGPHRRGERDPHEPLTRPVAGFTDEDAEAEAEAAKSTPPPPPRRGGRGPEEAR
jgi:hypothetical protein